MTTLHRLLTGPVASCVVLLLGLCGLSSLASCSSSPAGEIPGTSQRTFASADDAVVALIDAARQGSVAEVEPLFGAGFDELASDSAARTEGDLQRLAAAYDRQHALFVDDEAGAAGGAEGARRLTLAVGDDLWEFPVPLVLDGSPPRWRFDTAAGIDAVWAMRCDRNEGEALEFLEGCITA